MGDSALCVACRWLDNEGIVVISVTCSPFVQKHIAWCKL